MSKTAAPSATTDGSQARYYPTEAELWQAGPPIVDPAGADPAPGAPVPASPRFDDDFLHAAVHGGFHPGDGPTGETFAEEWVNVQTYGPPGIGRPNDQQFQTARTAHCQAPQSDEQGWGLEPGRAWPRYPVAELPNPDRNRLNHFRNGTLDTNVEDAEYFLAQERELSWQAVRQRTVHGAVVNVAPSVPYVETVTPYNVPTMSGGPVAIPGIDEPVYPF